MASPQADAQETHVLPTKTSHYEEQFNTLKIKPTLEYHLPKKKEIYNT